MKRLEDEYEGEQLECMMAQTTDVTAMRCDLVCGCQGCWGKCSRPDDHGGEHRCERHRDSCHD